jgi:hypothetical protein
MRIRITNITPYPHQQKTTPTGSKKTVSLYDFQSIDIVPVEEAV